MSAVTGVSMSYGDYTFKPVPMVTINKETFKTNGNVIGGGYNVSLNGILIPYTTGVDKGGVGVFKARDDLAAALTQDYSCFTAYFTGENCGDIILKGRPRVDSLSFDSSSDNNSLTMPYSIDLRFDGSALAGIEDYVERGLNLESLSTNYNVSYLNKPYGFSVASGGGDAGSWSGVDMQHGMTQVERTISAKGIPVGTGNAIIQSEVPGSGCEYGTGLAGGGGGPGSTGMGAVSGIRVDPLRYATDYIVSVIAKSGYAGCYYDAGGKAWTYPEHGARSEIFDAGSARSVSSHNCGAGTIHPNTFLVDRTVSADEFEGSMTLTDTFIVLATTGTSFSKHYAAWDVWSANVDTDSSQDGLARISVQGSIQGYPNYKFDSFMLEDGESAFNQAAGYFGMVDGSGELGGAYQRAKSFWYNDAEGYSKNQLSETADIQGPTARALPLNQTMVLNPEPISRSFGYNVTEGTIEYTFAFDTRPLACLTGGNILSEQISISRNRPIPVHAALTVLGRSNGPILQDIGTQTAYTADLSIEAVLPPPGACTGPLWFQGSPDYDVIVNQTDNHIATGEGKNAYFKTADNESFDVKTGRYTRSVSWIYTRCPDVV
tara:strand:+ start:3361 stop:5169 length:1809 start_codon:yes stop_codon:yes gene_type:complete